ncbi:MAG: hypothetical protein LDL26_05215 [Caenispirillum bisanense]|nr:hypothetical protein [Caenispirillum bisanense]MCA1972813.1 hypothetical protein [Caenispirillum sp.]
MRVVRLTAMAVLVTATAACRTAAPETAMPAAPETLSPYTVVYSAAAELPDLVGPSLKATTDRAALYCAQYGRRAVLVGRFVMEKRAFAQFDCVTGNPVPARAPSPAASFPAPLVPAAGS